MTKTRNTQTRRGAALVLVTVATGVASVLGLSLLAFSSLQNRAAANVAAVAEANYLAEAGVNVAMYYLQYPEEYTGPMPDGYYPGEDSINLGQRNGATVSTQVTYDIADRAYTVQGAAQYPGGTMGSVARTIIAKVKTIPTGALTVTPLVDAITTNADIAIDSGMTITGSPSAVRSLGTIHVRNGGRVIGNVITDAVSTSGDGSYSGQKKSHRQATKEAEAATGTGNLLSALVEAVLFQPHNVAPAVPTDPDTLVLSSTHLPNLKTYRYRNPLTGIVLTYNAQKLATNSYTNVTMGTSLMNPAGVFWTDQPTTLNKVTINGTLLMTNGATLTIGPGAASTITAANKYPALVSDAAIHLEPGSQLDVNGLVYARRITAAVGATGALNITGALALSDKVAPFPTDNYTGTVNVVYNSARAQIGGFGMSVADTDIRALQVLSWSGN